MIRLTVKHIRSVPMEDAIEVRTFEIENENGAKVTTPAYCVDAYKVVSDTAPLALGDLKDKSTLLEVNITGTSTTVLNKLASLYKLHGVDGPPFYIAISPKLRQRSPAEVEKLLEKLHSATEAIRELHVLTLIDPTLLPNASSRSIDFCKELSCVPLITAMNGREEAKNLERALTLQEEGIMQKEVLAISLTQGSMFSVSSLNKVKNTVKRAYEERIPLLVYGSRRGKSLKEHEGLRMAENILQYFLAADIVGPPRKAGSRGAGAQLQPPLLVPPHGLYYQIDSMRESGVEHHQGLLTEAARHLGGIDLNELLSLSPARIEELSTLNAISYTYELREGNPENTLENIKMFWNKHGLNEPLERLAKAVGKLRRTLKLKSRDDRLDSYLAGGKQGIMHQE